MFFETDYFRDDNQKEYVETYLKNLKEVSRPLWEKVIAYLRDMIHDSRFHKMPFWKPLGAGIFEIRHKFSRLTSRIYCCFGGKGKITLLCGGNKKSQKKDIVVARQLKIKVDQKLKK